MTGITSHRTIIHNFFSFRIEPKTSILWTNSHTAKLQAIWFLDKYLQLI